MHRKSGRICQTGFVIFIKVSDERAIGRFEGKDKVKKWCEFFSVTRKRKILRNHERPFVLLVCFLFVFFSVANSSSNLFWLFTNNAPSFSSSLLAVVWVILLTILIIMKNSTFLCLVCRNLVREKNDISFQCQKFKWHVFINEHHTIQMVLLSTLTKTQTRVTQYNPKHNYTNTPYRNM